MDRETSAVQAVPKELHAEVPRNGFSMMMPPKSWPSFRSSESTVSQPSVLAASMMAASQY